MGYPYQYPPQHRPPMPPKPGMSALTITLIVIGGVMALGAGGCLLLLVAIGASADEDHPQAPTTAATDTATPPATAPTAAAETDDDPPPVPTAAGPGQGAAPPPAKPAGGNVTPMWFCNATGYVRTCGFAGVCSNINVFGTGASPDRYLASNQAKMACEGQARARGGSTTCMVSCSVATKK